MTSFVPYSEMHDADAVERVEADAHNDIDALLLYMQDNWSDEHEVGRFRSRWRQMLRRR